MPENILVVEYEPRYAERVRTALSGQPFEARFARDGEEAMRALDDYEPKLIVLSSVVPKVSAPELIRAIRGKDALQQTPILLTVSGYTGTAPKQDALRMGASDILPKPYSESEFLGKVQQMLGVGQLTSSQIFGDLLHDETVLDSTVSNPGAKKPMNAKDDVDKILEETLAGVMQKKKDAPPRAKTAPGDLDKRLQDTLSGLEKSARRTSPGTVPVPKVVPHPAAEAAAAAPAPVEEKVPVSQPIFPAAVPPPPKVVEEEEPTDGTRFGQYVLLEKIATGGMAEVWKARMRGMEGFQKIVAIKKILPHLSDNQEFIEMFVDEAKLAAQLNHNNIIHIYDLGKIASSYYIAMEYVDGHDLKTILKRAQERDQPVGPELALFVASKVAAALDYAHRRRDFEQKEMGLVHRDVSPQNVLISQEGDIKLCDFGIAKAASKASHTQAGALKGKLQYMSPEQASGKPIDRRSDIFALATVLYEMLTGKKLFTGENEISILDQVREARVTPPSKVNDEVTADIDRVVMKALQKDPEQRYQTAGEFARDIDSILYNMKPTPTSADLAIYMHRLWSAEPVLHRIAEEPVHVAAPVDAAPDLAAARPPKPVPAPVASPTTSPGTVPMPAWEAPAKHAHAPKKKSPVVPISIAVVVVLAIAGGFLYMRSRGASTAPPAPATKPAAAAPLNPPVPAPSTQPVAAVDTSATAASTTATVAPQQPVLDQNAVNQEVQKRLAAERARLEQQQAQPRPQQPALTASAAPPRPAPRPAETQPATQTVAPPVNTQTQAPPPATVPTATQAPPPAVETAAPAPVRVREGDLVPSGTEGLVPAKLLRQAVVPYPPMARAQRIQGTVLMNVLVSETGQVLDVKVIRGRGAGLNEAAEQIVRHSSFQPPTKDGVRVKAWTTVPVDFKL
jgi:TonB family protein